MGSSGMRPQMKYADRRGAPAVVIVGEDERNKGTVTIKDLIVGAQKAKAIKDNTEWRESRRDRWKSVAVRWSRPFGKCWRATSEPYRIRNHRRRLGRSAC